jgi:hypothetical protein
MARMHVKPLPPRHVFLRHLAVTATVGAGLILTSLLVGMVGYHFLEGMGWVDSFANAAMILSGMGPLEPMKTTGGKIFAGCYALYSGLAIITIAAITFSPVIRRFLHRFHLETHGDSD